MSINLYNIINTAPNHTCFAFMMSTFTQCFVMSFLVVIWFAWSSADRDETLTMYLGDDLALDCFRHNAQHDKM